MLMTVRPQGSEHSKIAIFGEAPGEQEEFSGVPFVGDSGEELNNILTSAGISRGECYVSNILKFRPEGNKISTQLLVGKEGFSCITKDALENIEYLKEELKSIDARVIVALGNTPAVVLAGQSEILKRRGSIYKSTLVSGKKILLSVHPSYIIRNKWTQEGVVYHYLSIYDFLKAKAESAFPELRSPELRIFTNPTIADIVAFVNTIKMQKYCGFDIENNRKTQRLTHLGLAIHSRLSMSIPLVYKNTNYYPPEIEATILRLVASILSDKDMTVVGQNIMYDVRFMLHNYGMDIRCKLEDTMVAQRIYAPDLPSGLGTLCSIYTRIPYYKEQEKAYVAMRSSEEQFQRYNATDAAIVLEILPKVMRNLIMQNNTSAYRRTMDIHYALLYMQEKGMRVDTVGLEKLKSETKEEIDRLTDEFITLTGGVNPNSHKQLKDLFYGKLGFKPYVNKKKDVETGDYTTTETVDWKALLGLKKKGSREADILIKLRKISKLYSTYLSAELRDGRFCYNFNPAKPTTGRLSSTKSIDDEGGNAQNLPPAYRKYIVSDPGYIFVELDKSQAENRLVAYLAPEPKMIETFESGKDVHSLTASGIFNKSPEQISDEDGSAAIGDGTKSERFWGKKANHSFNYGLTWKGFSDRTQISAQESKLIHAAYHRLYPSIQGGYHLWVKSKLRECMTIENLLGRKRLFLRRWDDDLFNKAYSYIPQSTVADSINNTLIHIWDNRHGVYTGFQLINQIHDSILLQVSLQLSADKFCEGILTLKKFMETPLTFRGREFIIPSDIKIGVSWGQMKKVNADKLEAEYENFKRLAGGVSGVR